MKNGAIYFVILSFSCVIVEAFFSMFEMAFVSFNKVRLTYLATQKNKRAVWLSYLMDNPSKLFGTILIFVNLVMQMGAESARRFFEAMHLNSSYAPLIQAFLVVMLGELAPLFAARRHPESIALFNVPIIYFLTKVLSPITFLLEKLSLIINRIFKNVSNDNHFLTRDEIQRAFEEKNVKDYDLNKTINNIFSLKNLRANHFMGYLSSIKLISSDYNVEMVKKDLKEKYFPLMLIYHGTVENIIATLNIKDLLKARDIEKACLYGNSPWFVDEDISILNVLKQFKYNQQKIAVVLGKNGTAQGIITLEMILDYIFGNSFQESKEGKTKTSAKVKHFIVHKTISGSMKVIDFNKKYKSNIESDPNDTMSDLISDHLNQHPSSGDVIHIDNFEFIVIEPSLLGVKTLSVKSFK